MKTAEDYRQKYSELREQYSMNEAIPMFAEWVIQQEHPPKEDAVGEDGEKLDLATFQHETANIISKNIPNGHYQSAYLGIIEGYSKAKSENNLMKLKQCKELKEAQKKHQKEMRKCI